MKHAPISPGLTVFTDGACSGNPGPGGWGAILLGPDGEVRELGGAAAQTTNNRMELSAAIAALRWARAAELPVRLYTDSTYVISGITTWLSGWKRKGWRNYEGKPVLNRDLWEELDAVLAARGALRVSWHYVRGHTGSPGNERCDEIAVAFSKGRSPKLYSGPLSGYSYDLLDMPEDVAVPKSLFKPPKRSGGFYLSYLDGKLERHSAWSECSARVHGKSGAKFKKVSTPEEEEQTLRGWGVAG